MTAYLLDTNVLIALLRPSHERPAVAVKALEVVGESSGAGDEEVAAIPL